MRWMTSAGGFARDVRKKGEADASYSGGVEAFQFFDCDVPGDAGDAGRAAFHVIQCVDHDAVIGTVAGGLDDYETPETHFVDENFFLFLPGDREGLVLGFG